MKSIIGSSVPITDALPKATGETLYTGDLKLPGMVHGRLILSEIPAGRVKAIHTQEALKVPGVLRILTAEDFPDTAYNSALRFKDHGIIKSETVLSKEVRFVGDRIGVILAESIPAADEALKRITVEYEEKAAVFDEEEAVGEGSPRVHQELDNRIGTIAVGLPQEEIDALIQGADLIIEDQYKIPMVSQVPMETHTVIGDWRSGKLTIYASTQNTFAVRVLAGDIFGLPYHKVRVIQPTLGGSFGSKLEVVTELVAAGASMAIRRPVRIALTRKENMVASRTRNGATVKVRTGIRKDGTIAASSFEILTNTGAYVGSAMNVVGAMSHKLSKAYKFPIRFTGSPVLTNLPIAGAMRGYGSPQAFLGMQLHLDHAARELGIDPAALLLKNVIRKEEVDKDSFGNPELAACMERGMEMFRWESRKEEIARHNASAGPTLRGMGIGIGSHGSGVFPAHQDLINLFLRLNEDGTFNYWSAAHDMGNGSLTVQRMILAEGLGVRVGDIESTEVNTETCPWNLGDYASRGVFVEGEGARKLALAMKEQILEVAAQAYETTIDGLSLENGEVMKGEAVLGSLGDVAMYAQKTLQKELLATVSHRNPCGRSSYGAHFAEVEVDRETGEIKVLDYVAVHDAGVVINRMGIEGQLHGGIHMGIGYALSEKMTFDEKGRLQENSLKKYKVYKADEMPPIQVDFIEEGDTGGPYGAKSISECAVVPSAPAVLNAIADALGAPLRGIPADKEEILGILKKREDKK